MLERAATFDAVVVGAGPAGIAAAVTLGEAGRSVALIDDNPHAGGQIWRNRGGRSVPGPAEEWIKRLQACERVKHLKQTHVVAYLAKGNLLVECAHGARLLVYRSLVLATGARERFIPFPGWTLPGVFGAGAVQALVKGGMPVAGKTAVVAGTGPLLLAVADLLRAKGARVPLILEQAPASNVYRFGLSLFREPAKLAQAIQLRTRIWRTRYATSSHPLRAEASERGFVLTYLDGSRERRIDCDLLACGFNLQPNTELARAIECDLDSSGFVIVDRDRRTTSPDVYAAGEITGIGGVEKALVEGQIAARHIIGKEAGELAHQLDRADAFVHQLDSTFAIAERVYSITTPDSVVCRCEDVTLRQLKGCISARDAKLKTRCGMGPCQGRVCGSTVERLLGTESSRTRPPLMSTSVGTLALKPVSEIKTQPA